MTNGKGRRSIRVAPVLWFALTVSTAALADEDERTDTGARVDGPQALAPLTVDFSGETDQVAFSVDAGLVTMTYLPGDRDTAAAGLLLPADANIALGNIARVDPEIFDDLDLFTRPWLWEETCGQDLEREPRGCDDSDDRADRSDRSSGGCFGGGGWDSGGTADESDKDDGESDAGEVSFELGEYDGWILHPDGVDEAMAWLTDNDFATPPGTEAAVTATLADGHALVALKLDATASTGGWESPSAIRIRSSDFSPTAPVSLGTLGGEDIRDLIVYGLHSSDPLVPEVTAAPGQGHCLLDAEWTPDAAMAEAWHTASGVSIEGSESPVMTWEAWLPNGDCLDCNSRDRLPLAVAEQLGSRAENPAITRMRVRYDRSNVHEEPPIIVAETAPPIGVRRLLQKRWELEGDYANCDGTKANHPGTCFTSAYWAQRAQEPAYDSEDLPSSGRRCGDNSRAAFLLAPLLLVALRRRQWTS